MACHIPAVEKMLVSPSDFKTGPLGRVLWEELLVLSRFHSYFQADEWNFCPFKMEEIVLVTGGYNTYFTHDFFSKSADLKTYA